MAFAILGMRQGFKKGLRGFLRKCRREGGAVIRSLLNLSAGCRYHETVRMVLAYLAAARIDTSVVVPAPTPIGLGFARCRFWVKGRRDGWRVRLSNWNIVRND